MNSFEKEILDAHNKHRANHQAPPLVWSTCLTNDAQEWANRLASEDRIKHASTEDGENIYMAFGNDVDGDEVVDSWYDEIRSYSFGRPGFQSNTGHFSQVVWKGSLELGVGKAVGHDGKVFVVARYRPPGNNLRTFEENISPYKWGPNWNAGRWDRINYNEKSSNDPYKRHSGDFDYSTGSMHIRQEPTKRYSNGWEAIKVNDDRSWIQQDAPSKSNPQPEKRVSVSYRREPLKVKDDRSWIQKKGVNTSKHWSNPSKRMSNGYDYITSASVKLQEKAPSRISKQSDTQNQITEAWGQSILAQDKPTVVPCVSKPSKQIYGDWDPVVDHSKQGKSGETRRGSDRWDPVSDCYKAFPYTRWDSGNFFEQGNDSTTDVTHQAEPTRNHGAWDKNFCQETKQKRKTNKRTSARWQPGVNDVMFKEPQQERIFSTSNDSWKKQDTLGKTKAIAEQWEASNQGQVQDKESADYMRYQGIHQGSGKTRESIKRWEQNSFDKSMQPNKSNSVPYRTNQSNPFTRSSQSNQSFPINQSNRYSWPCQSSQPSERWDSIWNEDNPQHQKQRPASSEGTKIFEDKIQDVQMNEYQFSPYDEPRERKITTTIVDGPMKKVVSSLTITLKGNEGCIRSKSSEDLRPKSFNFRESRSTERGYAGYPYAEERQIRTDSRSKSSDDLRSRGTYGISARSPAKEDIYVAEEVKANQRQHNYDTTDGYRAMKSLSKFPSLSHFAQQALDCQNFYRALHGVSNLMWSPEIAESSQAWAEKLARDRSLKHGTRERGGDGENVAILTGISDNTAKEAVDLWYNEIMNYNFNKPGYHPKAGHFTQLVWKDSKEFGMGYATSFDKRSVVVVARYRPGGNILRQYELNVFPKVEIFNF